MFMMIFDPFYRPISIGGMFTDGDDDDDDDCCVVMIGLVT